jgi:hypothetical protein
MGHVAHMENNTNAYRISVRKLKERNCWDHADVLKCTLKKTGRGNMD